MIIERRFKCDKCGACCRILINQLKQKHIIDPDMCDEDGVCIYLDKNTNLCTIYDNRPLICRVDDIYDAGYYNNLSRSEYYKMNHECCEELKKLLKDSNSN